MKKQVLGIILLVMVLACILLNRTLAEESTTTLNIQPTGPYLVTNIPNQSWPMNNNLTGAFNLDDYFDDLDGDELSFSASNPQNITIVINSSNWVSFYPDDDFLGENTVVFTATDGTYNISSNTVYLIVGVDDEAPQWFNPTKNKATVYQSSYVNFSTSWTDNFELRDFIFSINQGSGGSEYYGNLSGTSDSSLVEIQISASPGTIVYWKFCANDSSDNTNCTDIYNFTVESRDVPPIPPVSPPSSLARLADMLPSVFKADLIKNFTVSPDFFHASLKQGAVETRLMRITNIGNLDLHFNLSVLDIEEFVILSDYDFVILAGQSKDIIADFSVGENTPPETYFGRLIINSSEEVKIPIVLDVNLRELDFDLNIEVLEEYKFVKLGEVVVANITITNLRDLSSTDMSLYLAIKDLYGNLYDSSIEKFLFNDTISFERNLTVPGYSNGGVHLFYGRVFDEKNVSIDSDTFEVGVRSNFLATLRSSFIFLLIFLLSLFALILMVVYNRQKEKERILSLYLMLNELKNLIKEGKSDKAVQLYLKIKKAYGEPISKESLENKEALKEEIRKLSEKLKDKVEAIEKEAGQENKKEDKTAKKEETKEVKETQEVKETKEVNEVKKVKPSLKKHSSDNPKAQEKIEKSEEAVQSIKDKEIKNEN